MPSTIVDRILAEYNTRKTAKDAILRRRESPKRVLEEPRKADPAWKETDSLICRFKDELVPVIGRAVSSEVAEALKKVRQDLIECLERQLFPLGIQRPVPAPERLYEKADSMETDLDLPAEEVNRQLNRVFAELDPAGEGAPFAKTAILPVLDRIHRMEDPPLSALAVGPSMSPEIEGLPELRIPGSPPAQAEQGAGPSHPSHGPSLEPRGGRGPAKSLREPAEPETVPEEETASRPPASGPMVHPEASVPETAPPAPAPEPSKGLLLDGDPPMGPIASQVVKEIRETLIPGIADGLSHILGQLEKSQERTSKELSFLMERVKALETASRKPQRIAGIEELAGKPQPGLASPPQEPSAAGPERSVPAAPASAVAAEGPREALPPPVQEPSRELEELPAGSQMIILLELREMERRLMKKIDSLRARRKKALPAKPSAEGSGNPTRPSAPVRSPHPQ